MRASFVEHYLKSGAIPIHLIRCKDTSGRDCHHFLMCPQEKLRMMKTLENKSLDLKKFGKIIASGFGRQPTEAILKKLLKEYNFDASTLM